MQPDVVVVGSCMIDLVGYAPRLPKPGETLEGSKFQKGFGGKGANQCVSAARLGAKCALVARLGDDSFGHEYLKALNEEGIDTRYVKITSGESSGMAQIIVADSGENQIVIVPGANKKLSSSDVEAAKSFIAQAKVILIQNETPLDSSILALKLKSKQGTSIVNIAPASPSLPNDIFTLSDIFCVNESEAEIITGNNVSNIKEAFEAGKVLIKKGCNTVIVTLGSQGAVLVSRVINGGSDNNSVETLHIPVPQLPNIGEVIDTTGAGDSFLGALGFFIAKRPELPLSTKISYACGIASISVRKEGTQKSYIQSSEIPKELLE